jgi:hypothetical protein
MTDAQSDDTTERAVSMWVEVREDGVAELCWDTDTGETNAVELSSSAAGDLHHEMENGPTVRHDLEASNVN